MPYLTRNNTGRALAFLLLLSSLVLTACGGGSSTSSDTKGNTTVSSTGGKTIPKSNSYTISGRVSGLSGVLKLQNNGTDNTTVSANGAFTFAISLNSGNTYNVTINKHPTGQICSVSSGGGSVVGNVSNIVVSCRETNSSSELGLFAGNLNGPSSADGTGATARFFIPYGVTTDSSGNVYVADTNNHTIRKITPGGVVSTLAGTAGNYGSSNGSGTTARFYYPYGVATDRAGNVYVADTNNHTIRKISVGGLVSTLAGTAGAYGSADGTGTAARFYYPYGLATDSTGNVYVADSLNHVIRKITPGGVVSTLAGVAGVAGNVDGTGVAVRFNRPQGIATDSSGNVYVADSLNHVIRKITMGGVVSTLAGTAGVAGSVDGTGAAARFNGPRGIATDNNGNLFVADSLGHTIRKITQAGVVTTVFGQTKKGIFSAGTLPKTVSFPLDVALYGSTLYAVMNNGVAIATNVH